MHISNITQEKSNSVAYNLLFLFLLTMNFLLVYPLAIMRKLPIIGGAIDTLVKLLIIVLIIL